MNLREDAAQMAASYINSTQRNVFLTGKAGTGKTTFLREIVKETHKNAIVAAPTGIAAINAGGVTLHSLFQLPFGTFLPSNQMLKGGEYTAQFHTPSSLLKSMKINKAKRKMLMEMELLIIDEVSMLRADICDAIDVILRSIRRKKTVPFGGVQLLLIGDMLQLPPVVKNYEWNLLKDHYKTIYFFDSLVFREKPPVYLEMKKIYRQTDQEFVSLLNHLRDNCLDDNDTKLLDSHYFPNLSEEKKRGAVSLTTHNLQADSINHSMLEALPGKVWSYNADIDGEFSDYLYPVDNKLELKIGAQIMFIKNDYSGLKRYFNGKIGVVENLEKNTIWVRFEEEDEAFKIDKYTWENKRFKLNKGNNEIEEKQIGSYTHYPIKLAWAITVHKSQGLTFDRAIIDVSRAFAPGQIYVALSRLRTMDGLILTRNLPKHGLSPDRALSEFSQNRQNPLSLKENLKQESFLYAREYLLDCFDFRELVWQLKDHIETYDKQENRSAKQKHKEWAESLLPGINSLKETSGKFQNQISKMTSDPVSADTGKLAERVKAAIEYFDPLLNAESAKIQLQIKSLGTAKGVKKYVTELKDIDSVYVKKIKQFAKSLVLVSACRDGVEFDVQEMDKKHMEMKVERNKAIGDSDIPSPDTEKKQKKKGSKSTKRPTIEVSFELYKSGKNVEEIAEERGLAHTTISTHLSQCVAKGLLPVGDFISPEKMEVVIKAYQEVKSTKLTDVKAVLGGEYSYEDVRFALAGFFANSEEKKDA
jgi:hypothetical protein